MYAIRSYYGDDPLGAAHRRRDEVFGVVAQRTFEAQRIAAGAEREQLLDFVLQGLRAQRRRGHGGGGGA